MQALIFHGAEEFPFLRNLCSKTEIRKFADKNAAQCKKLESILSEILC